MSLGVGRTCFREFFEGNNSIMRLNYYPTCQKPDLTLGTGPHCDPTSLTILHQDQVGGLEVFVDEQWHSVSPNFDAFVVNIGDTFMALSNGIYKSCLHRGGGEQHKTKEIAGLLPVPEQRQGREAAEGTPGGGKLGLGARVSRLHVAIAAGVHAEALQGRHEHARSIQQLGTNKPGTSQLIGRYHPESQNMNRNKNSQGGAFCYRSLFSFWIIDESRDREENKIIDQ
ncbi:hypothetical protein MLD38_033570 [Melastoma candidum]|uniref:Uncharacterized protein n=1 Tax=Melastoma candidum TaxID=119954 RepID=A0ACB9M7N3_9MYRT|nr:hypothetical protein MLD38_033570 [Melastoma candidum]